MQVFMVEETMVWTNRPALCTVIGKHTFCHEQRSGEVTFLKCTFISDDMNMEVPEVGRDELLSNVKIWKILK